MSTQPSLPLPKRGNFEDDLHAIQTGFFYGFLMRKRESGDSISPCIDDDGNSTPMLRVESNGEIFYVRVMTPDQVPKEWL